MKLILVLLIVVGHHCKVFAQLVVNVKAQTGEIYKETFTTNATDDSVTLDYHLNDGTMITQTLDFKQNLQIFSVMVLGEEELGQNPYQAYCFITKFTKDDFITSDAMSKLRQKNPSTIRSPEGDHGVEILEMDLSVNLESSSILSSHINKLCNYASASTFASEKDLKSWASQQEDFDWDWVVVREATHRLPNKGLTKCEISPKDSTSPCSCLYQVCLSWYPCGLKFCKGKDNSGKSVSYRCGIRTCRKCYNFNFFVPQKYLCIPNENVVT